jgi:hypothetical protein
MIEKRNHFAIIVCTRSLCYAVLNGFTFYTTKESENPKSPLFIFCYFLITINTNICEEL